MKWVRRRPKNKYGFTIIEIMMFLAISAAMLAAAELLFRGQQSKTQFEQGVHDFVSAVQQNVNQVGTSVFPGQSNYSCTIGPLGRPVLSARSGSTSSACIFLGNALQVVVNKGSFWTYPVLGARTDASDNTITSLADAMPEPITSLTSSYDTNWGEVLSSNVDYIDGSSGPSGLVGFYNSLQDAYSASGASGGQSIVAKGYNFNRSSINSPELVKCIEEVSGSGCMNTKYISDWKICLASLGSSEQALITFNSIPGGISTDINFSHCGN